MALNDINDRQNVLDAIAEYDRLGSEAFLKKYGFKKAREYWLRFNGKSYDSKAILGAAHGFARPDLGPLKAREFSGGEATVERKLRELDFDVLRDAATSDFLITWKESGWPHSEVLKLLAKFERDGVAREPWRFIAVRMVKPGDRVWLLKQGDGPKGIFGIGRVIGKAFRGKTGVGNKLQMMVPVEFVQLKDPRKEFLIDEARTIAILSESQLRIQASGISLSAVQATALERELTALQWSADQGDPEPFDPDSIVDARERILRSIAQRRGQQAFRQALMTAYGGRCAISGCDVHHVLEAAHISPYLGPETNAVANGLLLRADIHTLFDCGYIAIDSETLEVLVHPALMSTDYNTLASTKLRKPIATSYAPSSQALQRHRQLAKF